MLNPLQEEEKSFCFFLGSALMTGYESSASGLPSLFNAIFHSLVFFFFFLNITKQKIKRENL